MSSDYPVSNSPTGARPPKPFFSKVDFLARIPILDRVKKRSQVRRNALILGFILYVVSYLMLSDSGQYSSARATKVFGNIRVDWAPIGFVTSSGQWNYLMHGVYLPLYSLDRALWHTDTYHSADYISARACIFPLILSSAQS
jgi:hypothetical protein